MVMFHCGEFTPAPKSQRFIAFYEATVNQNHPLEIAGFDRQDYKGKPMVHPSPDH